MAVLSKPASFMGIPLELRLRVYEHLLTPHLTEADLNQLRDSHECFQARLREVPVCSCTAKNAFPQIVATNK